MCRSRIDDDCNDSFTKRTTNLHVFKPKTLKDVSVLDMFMQSAEKFEDLKAQIIIKIANEQQFVSDLLNAGCTGTASKRMAFLLLRLDIPSGEKEMLQLRNDLKPDNCNKSEVFVFYAYYLISDFLNRTYYKIFKGFFGVDPDAEFDKHDSF